MTTEPRKLKREARPQEDPAQQRIRALEERLNFLEQTLGKVIDDLMWFRRMDDIAVVDKVSYTGPPPRVRESVFATPRVGHSRGSTARLRLGNWRELHHVREAADADRHDKLPLHLKVGPQVWLLSPPV